MKITSSHSRRNRSSRTSRPMPMPLRTHGGSQNTMRETISPFGKSRPVSYSEPSLVKHRLLHLPPAWTRRTSRHLENSHGRCSDGLRMTSTSRDASWVRKSASTKRPAWACWTSDQSRLTACWTSNGVLTPSCRRMERRTCLRSGRRKWITSRRE